MDAIAHLQRGVCELVNAQRSDAGYRARRRSCGLLRSVVEPEQGLRLGIEALCDAFGIVLSAERKRELQTLDAAALEAVLAKLRAERRWP